MYILELNILGGSSSGPGLAVGLERAVAMVDLRPSLTRVFKMVAVILATLLLYKDAYDFSFKNPTIETTATAKMSNDLIPDIYICKDFTEYEAQFLKNHTIYGMESLIFGFGEMKLTFFNASFYNYHFNLSSWKIIGFVADISYFKISLKQCEEIVQ